MAAELNGKRLDMLRDIIPDLRRVAIIANPEHPGSQIERAYSENTARQLGLEIDFYGTATQDQLDAAFAEMDPRPPQAISLFADGFAIQYRKRIIDFGMKYRAPVISGWPVFARSGAICPNCLTRIADWRPMWIAFSKARGHPNCQLSSPRSLRR